MRDEKRSMWATALTLIVAAIAGLAIVGFAGISTARADLVSDHQFAGLLNTGEVYVTGEPGYEEGMWHHVTPAELATITQTGAGWSDITWYVDQLPGTIHIDPIAPDTTQTTTGWDHQLAGVLGTGEVYVTGEPGYEEGMWHHVTPAELVKITQTGAGWFDITWYVNDVPGTVHIDETS